MPYKSISGSAITRIAPRLEAAGIYEAGEGETNLRGGLEDQFTYTNFSNGVWKSFLFASASSGMTSSFIESRSAGGMLDDKRETHFNKMLGSSLTGQNFIDICKNAGKYCAIENKSGSGFFINSQFLYFKDSASIDGNEVFNNFQDLITNQISLEMTSGMTSHLQHDSAMAYLSGSVTSSINSIRAIYGKPGL